MKEMKEIDLLQLVKDIWAKKMLILIFCAVGFVCGLVIYFGKPKEYNTSVKFAAEIVLRDDIKLNPIGKIASAVGMTRGYNTRDEDAIRFHMYPDIVASFPFISQLFDMKVKPANAESSIELYSYILNDQKSPWWSFGGGSKNNIEFDAKNFNIETPKGSDYAAYGALKSRISLSQDKKTNVYTLSVRMQDPNVAYQVAKQATEQFKKYINDYRMSKISADLKYAENIYIKAKADYENAQANLENYKKSSGPKYDFLKNEVELKYSVYANLFVNYSEAKLRVEQNTPVCEVIEPAKLTISSVAPSMKRIVMMSVVLFGFFAVAFVVIKDRLI